MGVVHGAPKRRRARADRPGVSGEDCVSLALASYCSGMTRPKIGKHEGLARVPQTAGPGEQRRDTTRACEEVAARRGALLL